MAEYNSITCLLGKSADAFFDSWIKRTMLSKIEAEIMQSMHATPFFEKHLVMTRAISWLDVSHRLDLNPYVPYFYHIEWITLMLLKYGKVYNMFGRGDIIVEISEIVSKFLKMYNILGYIQDDLNTLDSNSRHILSYAPIIATMFKNET